MPWLDETRRESARAGVAGGAMAVWVCGGSGPERKLQRVGPKVPFPKACVQPSQPPRSNLEIQ